MLCCVVLSCVVLCCNVLCCNVLCYIVLCCNVLCYIVLCCNVLCYIVLCCNVLCYIVLCCVVLCYIVLCCVVLYVHCSWKGTLVVETNVSTSHHIPVEVEYSWPSIAGATRLQFAPTLVMETVVRNAVCDPLPPNCVLRFSSQPISLHYKAHLIAPPPLDGTPPPGQSE